MKKRGILKFFSNELVEGILGGVWTLVVLVFAFWVVWDLPGALRLLSGQGDFKPLYSQDGSEVVGYATEILTPITTVVMAVLCAGVLVVFFLRGLLALLGLFWQPARRWVWKK